MSILREIIFNILLVIILFIIAYRLFGFIIKNKKREILQNDEAYYSFIKPLIKPTVAWAVLEQIMFYYGYEKKASMMVLTTFAALLVMLNAAYMEKVIAKEKKEEKDDNNN